MDICLFILIFLSMRCIGIGNSLCNSLSLSSMRKQIPALVSPQQHKFSTEKDEVAWHEKLKMQSQRPTTVDHNHLQADAMFKWPNEYRPN